MFNRVEFSKVLFNRFLPFFVNYSKINLLGLVKQYESLIGYIKYELMFYGESFDINKLGQVKYYQEFDGEFILFYETETHIYPLELKGEAKELVRLIGEVLHGKN